MRFEHFDKTEERIDGRLYEDNVLNEMEERHNMENGILAFAESNNISGMDREMLLSIVRGM